MKEFVFVRHGQSESNSGLTRHYDSGLTPLGRAQAAAAGEYLATHLPDPAEWVLVVSPYRRALETADVLRRPLRPRRALVDPAVAEVRVGAEGDVCLPCHEALCAGLEWPDALRASVRCPAESQAEYVRRLSGFLRGVPAGRYAVVAHAGPIRTMRHLLMGLPPTLGHDQEIPNGSITWVRTDGPECLLYAFVPPGSPAATSDPAR